MSFLFKAILLISLLPLICEGENHSAGDSTRKERKVSFAGIALPSSNPENGFYVQGGLLALFKTQQKDSMLRTSNLYLFGLYSQQKQYRFSLGGDIFTKNENWYINGWYYYSYLPELFFGTGNNVSPDNKEFLNYRVWYLNTNVLKRIHDKWFAGIVYTYEKLYDFNAVTGGLVDQYKPLGAEDYTYTNQGIRVRYDSRDFIISSKKGLYLDMSFNFSSKALGSNYQFSQYNIDARKFFNLAPKKYHVLAFNFLLQNTIGTAPFRYLPNITARGYHPNLYKDNSLLSMQMEYRLLIWRFIGASFFGGASEVAGNFSDMNFSYIRENIGAGLRFRIIKKQNMFLRIEYGMSHNTSNYYVSFYDAF